MWSGRRKAFLTETKEGSNTGEVHYSVETEFAETISNCTIRATDTTSVESDVVANWRLVDLLLARTFHFGLQLDIITEHTIAQVLHILTEDLALSDLRTKDKSTHLRENEG